MAAIESTVNLSHPMRQEFLVIARSPQDDRVQGIEVGLESALRVARSLAMGGMTVVIQNNDPFFEDFVEYEVRPRR